LTPTRGSAPAPPRSRWRRAAGSAGSEIVVLSSMRLRAPSGRAWPQARSESGEDDQRLLELGCFSPRREAPVEPTVYRSSEWIPVSQPDRPITWRSAGNRGRGQRRFALRRAVFGRLSHPAVTRFAAVRPCSVPARVNLGGVTLERDCRSAARDAITGASRRSPVVLKSQPGEFPGERPPRGQEENRRQGCEADSVPCPHGLGRSTSVRIP
jgi:hypothetical protein